MNIEKQTGNTHTCKPYIETTPERKKHFQYRYIHLACEFISIYLLVDNDGSLALMILPIKRAHKCFCSFSRIMYRQQTVPMALVVK